MHRAAAPGQLLGDRQAGEQMAARAAAGDGDSRVAGGARHAGLGLERIGVAELVAVARHFDIRHGGALAGDAQEQPDAGSMTADSIRRS